jgi:transposase-like protein
VNSESLRYWVRRAEEGHRDKFTTTYPQTQRWRGPVQAASTLPVKPRMAFANSSGASIAA